MSSTNTKSAKIIAQLKLDRKALQGVLEWIVFKGHDKKYRKCKDCDDVGLTTTYHGKLCHECYCKFLRDNYARKNPEKKRG